MNKELKSTRVNGLTIKELEMVLSAGILANSKNHSRLKDGSKLKSNSDKLLIPVKILNRELKLTMAGPSSMPIQANMEKTTSLWQGTGKMIK